MRHVSSWIPGYHFKTFWGKEVKFSFKSEGLGTKVSFNYIVQSIDIYGFFLIYIF